MTIASTLKKRSTCRSNIPAFSVALPISSSSSPTHRNRVLHLERPLNSPILNAIISTAGYHKKDHIIANQKCLELSHSSSLVNMRVAINK